jgi:acyl-CoA reductase-like NAD-dependent aldehyde dehydrogenase
MIREVLVSFWNFQDDLNQKAATREDRTPASPRNLQSVINQKKLKPGASWVETLRRAQRILPAAWEGPNDSLLNLIGGKWCEPGHPRLLLSAIDGAPLGTYPMIDLEPARQAVGLAVAEAGEWGRTALTERKRRVGACVEQLRQHRELLALLLVWEIGKPFRQALTSVDRCIAGADWYLEHVVDMLGDRKPLGLVSNIASWNYPLSVLVHSLLVQMLCGNAVIAKTPTDGGIFSLTLSLGLARQCGLPVSLVSGSGGRLSDALVRNDAVDCLAFVGGKSNGGRIAASLFDQKKRYMLEMEGVNTYGIWSYADFAGLAEQFRKGFAYAKQRCTAYPRYVIQRELLPKFLASYLPMLATLRFGHPLLVDHEDDPLPDLDFGPLINRAKVDELHVRLSSARGLGAMIIHEGELREEMFLPDQDISAYLPPISVVDLPRDCDLYHSEPFGPIDSIVVVDTVEEMITEMNISGGALVASLATEDQAIAKAVREQVRAFKFGLNKVRSRGDCEAPFGGMGASWKGCFVGGKYLVHAVTAGPADERLYGNFPDSTLLPEPR